MRDEVTRTATDTAVALDFINRYFGATEQPVYICSLANDRDDSREPTERHTTMHDAEKASAFLTKWDRSGRGLFVCVSTIRANMKRNKDNVAEIPGLHADIDFKDVDDDEATILKRVKALPLPPSIIVRSGNGLHCYWGFKESITINIVDGVEMIERIEAALKLLADLVGGDMKVTQVAALMRLPGSHNSKFGEWKPVEIESNTGFEYELDDLEEMLATKSPVVLRKVRPSQDVALDAYAEVLKSMGFKPPVDVEKRLGAMTYMGGDDAGIHGTQISVSASLLNSGVEIDEVVRLVLEATRAAVGGDGGYGARWNWRREEKEIRNACDTWLRKHPRDTRPAAKNKDKDGGKAEGDKATKDDGNHAPKKKFLHAVLAGLLLESQKKHGEEMRIVTTAKGDESLWIGRANNLWEPVVAINAKINGDLEAVARTMGLITDSELIRQARDFLLRSPEIRQRDAVEWDMHGKIAVRGKLIDPKTMEIEPLSKRHYATQTLDIDHDPTATCPWWLHGLNDALADRPDDVKAQTISVLQEMAGMALLNKKDKALSKGMILFGKSNSGKTTIAETIARLISDHPIATSLEAISGPHGLQEFAYSNAPWLLHEAFGKSWIPGEKIKGIISGDWTDINIKNGPLITKRITNPIIWCSNAPVQISEASSAVRNRLIIFDCRIEFKEDRLVGLGAEAKKRGFDNAHDFLLATEKAGIFNWALAGMQRALARGYFLNTTEGEASLNEIRVDSNMVAGFLEECVSFGPSFRIRVTDFCAAFSIHWEQNKSAKHGTPSNDSVSRALIEMGDACIGISKELRDTTHRFYGGMHLNSVGLDYWEAATLPERASSRGKAVQTSNVATEVNRMFPKGWRDRATVKRVMKADFTAHDATEKARTEAGAGHADETDEIAAANAPLF
jgi:hypothetical protein